MKEIHVFEGCPEDCRQVIEEKLAEGFAILAMHSFAGMGGAMSVVYFMRPV